MEFQQAVWGGMDSTRSKASRTELLAVRGESVRCIRRAMHPAWRGHQVSQQHRDLVVGLSRDSVSEQNDRWTSRPPQGEDRAEVRISREQNAILIDRRLKQN